MQAQARVSRTIVSAFQDMAARFPNRPCVCESTTTTYEQIDRRAKGIASYLAGKISRDQGPVVGLSFSQTPQLIAAMLGVMMTGRAFTVIEKFFSLKRKLAIVEEMGLEHILVDKDEQAWPGFSGLWMTAEAAPGEWSPKEVLVGSQDSCFIVQTSGTTGKPLGIEITHQSLLHTIENYTALAGIQPEDRFTLLTSAAHFAALTSIFGALLNGACILPFNVVTAGFARMAQWMERENLTIYQSPPSLFRAFVRDLPGERFFPGMRFLRLGGEPVLKSDFALFKKHFSPRARFAHTLGMSEAGGNVTSFCLSGDAIFEETLLPIGFPAEGQNVILVDDTNSPVKPGEIGEIMIRSHFLAKGYYRRPELTAQRFRMVHPNGLRELLTGDLAHVAKEGWLMHDGRKDDQVKVRGHRVNLAGMGALLSSLSSVKETRVLLHKKGFHGDELIAFVVPCEKGFSTQMIHQQLSRLLSGPVLPRLVVVDSLPLTPGGKVDSAELLRLMNAQDAVSSSAPARNETERTLAEIWSAVLEVKQPGVYDNFFALGGDSLKAIQVSLQVESTLDVEIPTWLYLERATIAQMSEYISSKKNVPGKWRIGNFWKWYLPRQKSEQIVVLRRGIGDTPAPLFICPGGWSHERELLVFAGMLPFFPADLPVYGFKQTFLENSAPVTESVTGMAKNFLKQVKKIQPVGPYRLLGECIGSLVILELADLLKRKGDGESTLILLDPRTPLTPSPNTGLEPEEIAKKVRAYYKVLFESKPRSCSQNVRVIGTEEPDTLRRQMESLNQDRCGNYHLIRVPGDHTSYIREHRAEVAKEILLILAGS